MKRILFSILILVVLTNSALAQNIVLDRSDHLKQIVTDMLEAQKPLARRLGAELSLEGDVHVERSGSYYAVTTPFISLGFQSEDEDQPESNLTIGMVAINAAPVVGSENQWRMAVALPTPLILQGSFGLTEAQMEFSDQKMSLLYDDHHKLVLDIQAEYGPIGIVSETDTLSGSTSALSFHRNLTSEGEGQWQAQHEWSVSDIVLDLHGDGQSVSVVKIGHILSKQSVTEFNPAVLNSGHIIQNDRVQDISLLWSEGKEWLFDKLSVKSTMSNGHTDQADISFALLINQLMSKSDGQEDIVIDQPFAIEMQLWETAIASVSQAQDNQQAVEALHHNVPHFKLKHLNINLPDFQIDMTGEIKPAESVFGMQGYGELSLSGLSQVNELAQERAGSDPRVQMAVTMLPFIAALGERVDSEGGLQQIRFAIALDEKGYFSLNGQDVGGLFNLSKNKGSGA